MAQLLFYVFPETKQGLRTVANGIIILEDAGSSSVHIVFSREQARAQLHRCRSSKPPEGSDTAAQTAYQALIKSSLPETSSMMGTNILGNGAKIISQLFLTQRTTQNRETSPSPPPMPGSLLGAFCSKDSPGVYLVPIRDPQRNTCVSLIFAEDQLHALLHECLPWAPDKVRFIARNIKEMELPLTNPSQPVIRIFHDVARGLYQILQNGQTPHLSQEA